MPDRSPYHPMLAPRRSPWRIFVAPLALLLAGLAWSAFWFYAAGQVEERIDGWRAREQTQGRLYACGDRAVSGYPFRLEVSCDAASVTLVNFTPSLKAQLDRILVVAQVYDPSLLIAEFTAPVALQGGDEAPSLTARWRLAQASLRGLPETPQRISVAIDDLALAQAKTDVATARHLELHARAIAAADAAARPDIELVLRLQQASAPTFHALVAEPLDADVSARLRGLPDFSPMPWPQRFRALQAAGGRIEVTQSRVQQGELLATASGSLGIDPAGHLQGQLDLVVAGLDKLVAPLGLDELVAKLAPQGGLPGVTANDVNSLVNTLDSVLPGLGNLARQHAGATVAAGINALGKATELEGRAARALPLRFADGVIYLGPLPVGRTPALF